MITRAIKDRVRAWALGRMHARPAIVSRVATRVARDGLSRYLTWNFGDERRDILRYVEGLRVGEFAFRFASSCGSPTIYGSVYACMLLGMYGELDRMGEGRRKEWLRFFDGFQDPSDGYFRDPVLAGPEFEGRGQWGDGWGIRHLAGHIIIPYARLGRPPRHRFRFLDCYYDAEFLREWLGRFDFDSDVWSKSNYVMNVYTLMQYARDHMSEARAESALAIIRDWLVERQRSDTGMWHAYEARGYPQLGDAIRGAYHYYPLFSYDDRALPYPGAIVDTILRSQNAWGGFNPEDVPSGACEDIDAIDPLIRAALGVGGEDRRVELALQRAMVWMLACKNPDGGFECIPEHGWSYGGHPLTTSRPGESNLFATWFRTLCLAYVTDFMGIRHDFKLGRFPGYEIAIRR